MPIEGQRGVAGYNAQDKLEEVRSFDEETKPQEVEEKHTLLWTELEEFRGQRPYITHKPCFFEKVGSVATETLGSAQERRPKLAQRIIYAGPGPREACGKGCPHL